MKLVFCFLTFVYGLSAQDSLVYKSLGQVLLDFSLKNNQSLIHLGGKYLGGNSDKFSDAIFEVGYVQSRYSKSGHDVDYLKISKKLIIEKSALNLDYFRFRTGIAFESFFCFGIYALVPTNFKNYSIDIYPEIGIRYFNFQLNYGYQLNMFKNAEIHNLYNYHHNFGLSYVIPFNSKK